MGLHLTRRAARVSDAVKLCGALTRVAVGEQGADGEQDLGDGEGWAPVVLQDVQADHALTVDVAVVDPGAERHLETQNIRKII